MSLLQILETTIFLSLLVFLHELGHFLAAKFSRMKVEEFGVGYPPRLWGKRFGDTLYSLNAIPFGGFCRFSREEFGSGSGLRRAVVVLAGVLANFFWGWFLLSILFAVGNPSFEGVVTVVGVSAHSPAKMVGIDEGDAILSVSGVEVETTSQLVFEVKKYLGQEVVLEVQSKDLGEVRRVPVVPRENPPEGEGALGVTIDLSGQEFLERTSILAAPVRGFREAVDILREMVIGLGEMLRGLVLEFRVPQDVAGPVGIYQMTAAASKLGLRYLMQFVAFLSLNLTLLNLFPIPALDGGQLVFILVEAVRGRKARPEVEQLINGIGMVFLALLAVLLTVQDVKRLL